MEAALSHGRLMDRVYRRQRYIYDATRKYYLIGRDPMMAALAPPPGGTVLEIGCGTGRNLVQAGERYPRTRLFGIDISMQMLATAGGRIAGRGLRSRTRLAHADAATFGPAKVFAQEGFDRVFISYALSMIPAWESVVVNAVRMLAPGGALHMVDFGDLDGWPPPSRALLDAWLRWHHVTPRRELFEASARIARAEGCRMERHSLHAGYAWIAVIRRPPALARTGRAVFSAPAAPSPPHRPSETCSPPSCPPT